MSCTRIGLLAAGLALLMAGPVHAQPRPTAVPSGDGVVRAVLFVSENCPHCGELVYKFLPPIQEEFGSQLRVVQLKTQEPLGNIMYKMAQELYLAEADDRGVPWLVIDDRTLLGSLRIRDDLPGLVRQYQAEGGLGWPAIPGLAEAVSGQQPATAAASAPPAASATPEPTQSPPPTATVTPTSPPTATATAEPSLPRLVAGSPIGRGLALVLIAVVATGLVLVARSTRAGNRR